MRRRLSRVAGSRASPAPRVCVYVCVCVHAQTWTDWLQDKDARKARVVADVEGDVQLGRTAWVASAGEYPDLKLLDKV